MPKEELYIKDQWARMFGEEVDTNEDQDHHWKNMIIDHLIPMPNILIDLQHVLILDLHAANDLHNLVLNQVTFSVPKSLKHDSLIGRFHDERVMLHGSCFETYIEIETLK